MPKVVQSYFLYTGCLAAALHFMLQEILGEWKNPIVALQIVQLHDVAVFMPIRKSLEFICYSSQGRG